MNVLDLFSGIGGFSLGLERAGMRTVAFCEIEPYPRAVLKKHWPDVPCYDDIRTLTAERLKTDGIGPIDVICGGFPCQPYSAAGKRLGETDNRALWPEYRRLVKELRPTWVVGENVIGFVDMGLDTMLDDLGSLGYSSRPFDIPACAIGAAHTRRRIWIIANSNKVVRDSLVKSFKNKPKNISPSSAEKRGFHRPPSLSVPLGRVFSDPSGGSIRNDNGIPGALDRIGCLGNALVPQIVEIIGKAIMQSQKEEQ